MWYFKFTFSSFHFSVTKKLNIYNFYSTNKLIKYISLKLFSDTPHYLFPFPMGDVRRLVRRPLLWVRLHAFRPPQFQSPIRPSSFSLFSSSSSSPASASVTFGSPRHPSRQTQCPLGRSPRDPCHPSAEPYALTRWVFFLCLWLCLRELKHLAVGVKQFLYLWGC